MIQASKCISTAYRKFLNFQYLQSILHNLEFFKIHYTIFLCYLLNPPVYYFFSKVQFLFGPLIGMTYGSKTKSAQSNNSSCEEFCYRLFLVHPMKSKVKFHLSLCCSDFI